MRYTGNKFEDQDRSKIKEGSKEGHVTGGCVVLQGGVGRYLRRIHMEDLVYNTV